MTVQREGEDILLTVNLSGGLLGAAVTPEGSQ
ncbi:MAG: hypothetical protein ACI9DF_005690 [Verrucomicrobiales bacterium]|jgi:hypothetical protein